jgi:predicted N-acetyltransferase YhbS
MAQMTIRRESRHDVAAREALLDAAFGEGCFAKTAERLREGRLPAKSLSFVACTEAGVIGTVRLWNISAGANRPALLLGPLTVAQPARNRGVGAALVRHSLHAARAAGHAAVLLVGDAPYYGRFGFRTPRLASSGCRDPMNATGCSGARSNRARSTAHAASSVPPGSCKRSPI